MQEQDLVFDSKGHHYMRTCGEDMDIVCNKIRKLYNCGDTSLVCSGLNAIYLTLHSIFEIEKEGICLISRELYCDTPKLIHNIIKQFNKFRIITFPAHDSETLANLIKKYDRDVKCIFLESCSNPSGYMIDWKIFNNFKGKLVVDNTWLTGLLFNPFEYGAYIVVESCTKYLSNGKCIAGAISYSKMNDLVYDNIDEKIHLMGIHVSPIHCRLISSGLDKLEEVFDNITKRTTELNEFLSEQKLIDIIMHPMNKNHLSHDIYKKYVNKKYQCGVIWFHCNNKNLSTLNKYKLGSIVKECGIIWQTSYGKEFDLLDMYPKKDENGIWLRLSIGSVCSKDITNNLVKLFKLLTNY